MTICLCSVISSDWIGGANTFNRHFTRIFPKQGQTVLFLTTGKESDARLPDTGILAEKFFRVFFLHPVQTEPSYGSGLRYGSRRTGKQRSICSSPGSCVAVDIHTWKKHQVPCGIGKDAGAINVRCRNFKPDGVVQGFIEVERIAKIQVDTITARPVNVQFRDHHGGRSRRVQSKV